MSLWTAYVASGYKRALAPSFDREDDSIGYSWGNFNKWMTWHDNDEKWNKSVRDGIVTCPRIAQKPVQQLSMRDVVIKEYVSTMDAQRATSIGSSGISMCCSGLRKSAGGFKWKYKTK